MTVLSIYKCLKLQAKYIIPILIIVSIVIKNVSSNSPAQDDGGGVSVEKLPYCNEDLINDRDVSKR